MRRPSLGMHPLVQLTLTKVRELLREPEAVFWIFAFPIILAGALGLAFRTKPPEPIPVGVESGAGGEEIQHALAADPELKVRLLAAAETHRALATGKVVLVVIPSEGNSTPTYWLDPTRPESRAARLEVDAALERAAGRSDRLTPHLRELNEKGSRYIDFLVPGLIGMNLMGTGMWAIGFYLVQARANQLLKRFIATPMRRGHFLLGQILARQFFLFVEIGALLVFAHFLMDVPIRGSLALLALVAFLGGMTFVGLGLLTASRAKTIEGVSGIMNLVMVPMWIFSGIFFSTERFPDAMQPAIRLLPLTALNEALRGVMLDGAGLAAVATPLAIVVGWGLVTFVAALKLFRWQ